MGVVYEGLNERIGRRVAIKLMHPNIARDQNLVARFEREAQAAAKIGSSHLVDVLDLGDMPNGDKYMVMEYLEGETLAARLKDCARLAPEEIARIAVQLCEGLSKVHEAGVLHRDLKPANVFLVPREDGSCSVKILDLGICKFMDDNFSHERSKIGDIMGTLSYMAPEHLEHGALALDERVDIYSVGVMLYRCVSGVLPYSGATPAEMVAQLRKGKAPPLSDRVAGIDAAFTSIVESAMEWDPAARFPSALALRAQLSEWLATRDNVTRLLSEFLDVPHAPSSAPSASSRKGAAPVDPRTDASTSEAFARTVKASAPPPAPSSADELAPTTEREPSHPALDQRERTTPHARATHPRRTETVRMPATLPPSVLETTVPLVGSKKPCV